MFWNSMTFARMLGSTAPNLNFPPSRITANFSTSKAPTPSYQPGLGIPSRPNADGKWVCPAIGCKITRAKKSTIVDHMNAHDGIFCECPVCGLNSGDSIYTRRHVINNHPEFCGTEEHKAFEEEMKNRFQDRGDDDEEGEDDAEEMLLTPAISRPTQCSQSMVGPSTKSDMMGGSFPGDSVTGRMNVPGFGAPSMSSAMGVGWNEFQSGAAQFQSEESTKKKKQLDVDGTFGDVLEAYNNYSSLEDGLRARLRKTALNLLSAVHAEEMKEEEEEEDDVV